MPQTGRAFNRFQVVAAWIIVRLAGTLFSMRDWFRAIRSRLT
jgi:hypothetical protein